MATVNDLIQQLNQIEDKEQPIVFQYWLAEHFDFADGTPAPTYEQFAEAGDNLWADTLWQDALDILTSEVYEVVSKELDTDK